MRRLVAVVGVAVMVSSCASRHESKTSSQSDQAQPVAGRFTTSDVAIRSTCHAYWVGQYIVGSARTQRQWETRAQYESGTGYVARIVHSARGYRVVSCRELSYAHG